MSKVPMTVAGEAALREELENLKKVVRPRIIEAIADHGHAMAFLLLLAHLRQLGMRVLTRDEAQWQAHLG